MDICELGVKESRKKILTDRGFDTVEDILFFFPRKYLDFSQQLFLDTKFNNKSAAIVGIVNEVTTAKTNNTLMVKAKLIDEITGRKLHIIWIGSYYIYNIIKNWESERVIACGTLTYNEEYHSFHMNNPLIFDKRIDENLKIFPIYTKMKRISEDYMQNLITEALKIPIKEKIPKEILQKHKLMDIATALHTMHHPKSLDELTKARQRIIFDKLLSFSWEMENNSRQISKGTIYNIKNVKNTEQYIKDLPYSLTPSQLEVYEKMKEQAMNGQRISALIQGDVGSGKTTSAFLMMFAMADSGYQSLIMAPTVILAKQHYKNLSEAAEKYGYKVAFLGGKQNAREKKMIINGIADGSYTFIVGTHSVISENVTYNNLALAIIDEEHKFGVKQRNLLAEKAKYGVHNISMSATPIPRTIATSIYGSNIGVYDLQVPSTRKPVQTAICNSNKTIFNFIEKQLELNQQVYVVCPYIDDNENKNISTVENTYEEYANYFGKNIVGYVTGKMDQEQASEVIEDFSNGSLKILISTTIIEVGVNVPSANIIVISNAERFGLAQLHQLRGRVGRGSSNGYCILKSPDRENERLKIMCTTTNGYKIAEEDMRLRGTGDLLGTEQTGQNEYISLILKYPNMYSIIKEDAKQLVDKGISIS